MIRCGTMKEASGSWRALICRICSSGESPHPSSKPPFLRRDTVWGNVTVVSVGGADHPARARELVLCRQRQANCMKQAHRKVFKTARRGNNPDVAAQFDELFDHLDSHVEAAMNALSAGSSLTEGIRLVGKGADLGPQQTENTDGLAQADRRQTPEGNAPLYALWHSRKTLNRVANARARVDLGRPLLPRRIGNEKRISYVEFRRCSRASPGPFGV